MAQNTQSRILSIDEQIQKLKEKKNKEIAKLERNTGKRFLEKFNLQNKPLDEIYSFIDSLEELSKELLEDNQSSDQKNEQSNK
ncbi:hypothetical protein [Bacillus gobiensis]|uniref:hypothetical protein n=1 Tax=Bacillus gobiensis TaxID=1441095 RepID=UPI003D1C1AF9